MLVLLMVKMVAFEVGVLMIFLITGNFVDEVGAQTVMDFSLNERMFSDSSSCV